MDELHVLRDLAHAARSSTPPPVDPVEGVLRDITTRPSEPIGALSLLTGLCSAAAIMLSVLALQALAVGANPLNEWFSAFEILAP